MLAESVTKLGLSHIKRHIFLCCDQAKPKCCTKEDSMKSWQYLKKRLKELNLDHSTPDNPSCVFRTKVDCLRVCVEGPILLVYPDGTWYRNATPDTIEKIIQEHLIGNKIVTEYLFHQHPLPLLETEDTSQFNQ